MSTKFGILVFLLALGCSRSPEVQLPVIAELPAPALVDQNGQAFDAKAFEGKLWVASFIFTHCRSTCPRLTAQMRKLQSRIADLSSAHLLSVSVDPRNDTPEVIKAYMKKNGFDERNWRFVTGSEAAVQDFVVGGFRAGYGRTPWSTELTHSRSFALVDRQARIRGYYDSNDEGLIKLETDLRTLAE